VLAVKLSPSQEYLLITTNTRVVVFSITERAVVSTLYDVAYFFIFILFYFFVQPTFLISSLFIISFSPSHSIQFFSSLGN
jgi:hypothetical protein